MSTRALAVLGFLAVFVGVMGIEWTARRPSSKIPALAALCGLAMRYRVGRLPVGRIALLGFWWWLGWHFFAR